jgi:DNA-binding winged helix-turn-helix (wHTH) protein
VQLREVWGPSYETETNYLRVYLPQLRRKLEPELSRPKYLLTESGMGYRFKTPGRHHASFGLEMAVGIVVRARVERMVGLVVGQRLMVH